MIIIIIYFNLLNNGREKKKRLILFSKEYILSVDYHKLTIYCIEPLTEIRKYNVFSNFRFNWRMIFRRNLHKVDLTRDNQTLHTIHKNGRTLIFDQNIIVIDFTILDIQLFHLNSIWRKFLQLYNVYVLSIKTFSLEERRTQ